eukprot:10136242-Alexandrium_andersonii.AAC.1
MEPPPCGAPPSGPPQAGKSPPWLGCATRPDHGNSFTASCMTEPRPPQPRGGKCLAASRRPS